MQRNFVVKIIVRLRIVNETTTDRFKFVVDPTIESFKLSGISIGRVKGRFASSLAMR